jgi:hypothetical protein
MYIYYLLLLEIKKRKEKKNSQSLSKAFKINSITGYIFKGTEINMLKKYIYTSVFIALLFTIVNIRKQSECPSIEEKMKKIWHICTM